MNSSSLGLLQPMDVTVVPLHVRYGTYLLVLKKTSMLK